LTINPNGDILSLSSENIGVFMIVYLHGFASSGSSPKVDALRDRFGTDSVVAPDLPFDPALVWQLGFDLVNRFVKTRTANEKLIFVGTSLGAFYASYFGHVYDCPIVLVNPSGKPSETLKAKLGTHVNYVTGDEFMVSLAHLDELAAMRKYVENNYSGSLVSLFAARDDEVIPFESMIESFPYTSKTVVMDDGGHRFTKHWDLVVDRVAEIINW
jgi:predicted esterase YcpF (UPF0227 family)